MKRKENKSGGRTVIIADGSFPVHEAPLEFIKCAEHVICCDGSAGTAIKSGFIPEAIVGDMDSLGDEIRARFSDIIYPSDDQETNDLTKSVNWCIAKGYSDIVIVGATGKREDHTIGNISLLAEYIKDVKVIMVTDTGTFIPLVGSADIQSFPGQQVSVFSIDPATEISSSGLKYQLVRKKIGNWWEATLNEASGESFRIEFTGGRIILYLKH